MPLKTPSFWYERDAPLSTALLPLSALYRLGHFLHRRKARAYTPSISVICIGNLVAGGSGKTPTALAIAALLKKNKLAFRPFFLTRGYGGTLRGPVLVDENHTAAQVGDEPLLLARACPTVVASDRAAGAKCAEQNRASLIVMDDGLQNPGIAKTVTFAVIDAATGFGNKRLLPAGPLRVPLQEGLDSADAFIVIGGAAPPELAGTGKPVFTATLETSWQPAPGTSWYAFCGLGRPEKFFQTVRDAGAPLAGTQNFPDHHPYKKSDLDALAAAAKAHNALLLTTEKDAARLPPGYDVDVLPVTLRWSDEAALLSFLQTRRMKPS